MSVRDHGSDRRRPGPVQRADRRPKRLFFAVGLGTAIHNGEKDASKPDMKALGSRVLFHIPVEIGLRFDDHNSLSVYFEHTSNGYTQDFNEGLDRLGVRYGYRF